MILELPWPKQYLKGAISTQFILNLIGLNLKRTEMADKSSVYEKDESKNEIFIKKG